jgi:hypothetical protein
MMQTEIKILQYLNGQVVKTFILDLYDNIPIPVNKSIIDIKEPEKRKSDYTLPIKVPATANNRAIFSNIQDLNRSTSNRTATNFNPDFNVNLKSEALIIRSGIILMRGNLQLTQIPVNDQEAEFELVIIGKLANLFQDLGDKKLSEIDLSEYNHAWTINNVTNSWATSIIKNGSSYVNFSGGTPTGEGYVYPLIDNGLSSLVNNVAAELEYELEKTMYPAIYIKQIVDKIFSAAGYRYNSRFFDSTIFKKLIMPFTGGTFISTESIINDKTFIVKNASAVNYTTTNTSGPSDVKRYLFDTIVKNTTVPSVDLANDKIDVNSSTAGKSTFTFNGDIVITNNQPSTYPNLADVIVVFDVEQYRSGVRLKASHHEFVTDVSLLPSGNSVTRNVNFSSPEFDVESGDDIYVNLSWRGFIDAPSWTFPPSAARIALNANCTFRSSPSSKYTEGNTIDISSTLPKEIKQKDFLTWLFRAFNLYAIPDTIDANKLIIEPRDDFYTSDVVDITNNLDVSSEVMINPMGVLDFRDFVLKYKEDKDEYNSKYQDLFGEVYSTKKYAVENDFLTQTNTVEIGFSPSPLANSNGYHDRIYTKIRKLDPNSSNSELPSYNIRMLIYGGLVATSQGWQIKTKLSGTSFIIVGFPYAGMLDSTSAPTFDLGFAQPKAIYYGNGSTAYTNGNLFKRYWEKTILEITDKDSKIITAKFQLNEVEFNALSFRKIYLLNKQYYRLYTIKHDLNSDGLVEIELLKLKTAPAFTLVSGTGNGGSGGVIADEEMPMYVRADNTDYFDSQARTQFRSKEQNDSYMYLQFGSDINFVESSGDVYLPDAATIQPLTGDPIIIVKNIHGGSVRIYPINAANLVNGGASYNLQNHHCVWFVAYKGNWQILHTGNTGGG